MTRHQKATRPTADNNATAETGNTITDCRPGRAHDQQSKESSVAVWTALDLPATPKPAAQKPGATAKAPRQTKVALLQARLAAPGGVSLAEMMQETGWQAHTLRAALSGLRKAGLTITCRRDGGDVIYAIDPTGSVLTTDGEVGPGAEAAEASPGIAAPAPAVRPVTASGTPDAPITEPGQART